MLNKRATKSRFFFAVTVALFTFSALPSFSSQEGCSVFDAVYVPARTADKIRFEMEVQDNSAEGFPVERGAFYLVTAYDSATGAKLSALRLGLRCAHKWSECSASALYGQFAELDTDKWHNFETPLVFDVVTLTADGQGAGDYISAGARAPAQIILPNPAEKFSRNKGREKDWKLYTQYATPDEVFPDFSGHEVWRFERCKSSENPSQIDKH